MTAPGGRGSWTLRRRIGVTFGVLSGIGVLLVAVVVFSTVEFVLAGNAVVNRWAPANTRTQRLVTDLLGEQADVRGYALTRDRSFVDRYASDRTAQQRDLRRLGSLVGAQSSLGSSSSLAAEVDSLGAAADAWRRQIAEPAIRGIAAGDAAAVRLAESPRADQLFAEVRARATRLSRAVQRQTDRARAGRRDYLSIFIVALSLAVGVVIAAAFFVWRGLHRWVLEPIERLGAQTREVAGGDTYRQIAAQGPVEFTALSTDVEAMRLQIAGQLARAQEIQEELRIQGEELARSNDDLQQFAYVASHDLSEPLRKVANFCQLLERQYGPQLDDRARQYIDFAVDGAKRMQRLISDLLALSRVGRTTEQFVAVDLDDALDDALSTLNDVIAESGARVERMTKLPVVPGDQSLLTSLFENLVGNAVKYRREDVSPLVRIRAEHGETAWTISVEDNGIGIDAEYAERIFVVFQRLHLRDKYGGTGIGLALCRKIVEFHGGRIWLADVESEQGATFRFTFPKGVLSAESRD
jgi:signal transduction histidine kinase